MDEQESTTIPTCRVGVPHSPRSPGNGWRVGNVGLLLIQAAKQGSRDNLEFLFDSVPQAREQVDYTDSEYNHETPLMIAAKHGHLECVKVLISYGADLKRSTPHRHLLSKSLGVLQLAEKGGHTQVASYVQQCLQDQKILNTTRAHLERTVCTIASNPNCTDSELNSFSMSLRNLIWLCKCDINLSLDGETPSLLHRAVQANNFSIVLKLLDEFKANPLSSDHKTGDSILHTACRQKCDLRFFIANRYPDLLRKRNIRAQAEQPLHVACSKKDISFISWLFKNILAEESAMDGVCSLSPTPSSLPRCESLASIKMNSAKIVQQLHTQSRRTTMVARASPSRSLIQVNTSLLDLDPESELNRSQGSVRSQDLLTPDSIDIFAFDSINGCHSNLDNSLSQSSSSLDIQLALPRQVEKSLQKMKIADIIQKSPLTVAEVYDLLPSLTSNGDSVFHILARENCPELLTRMFKVAEFVQWRINLNMLIHRYLSDALLPIEEAIRAKNIECVEVILHFLNISSLLPELLQDPLLLKGAVLTADLDIVKVLISYGFHKGLQSAITQAIKVGNEEILRVLLHYQTKVVNALEFSHITDDQVRALHHSNGGIKWEGLELESINIQWLYDCYNAVDSVSKVCSLLQVLLSGDDNHLFFHQLGQDCLYYFSRATTLPAIKHPSYQLTSITKVNLNKNQLTEVPLELFQLPSLLNLTLSNNRLKSLPSSENACEKIYTAPILILDLDHNDLKTIPECFFRDLAHSLTELNVSWNSLHNLPPGLWVIPKLTSLKLAHNDLSQLHYLSIPKYFNEPLLSNTIVGSFRVADGVLVCEDALKDERRDHIETYMHRLADFRNTVCAVKFLFTGLDSNTMSDIMGVHLARIEYFSSSEQHRQRAASTPTIQGECLFPANKGEEKESTVSNLLELDLSYNKFSQFPWDLACIAPQLTKLHMHNNQIQDLDIVHSVPHNLKSLKLDKNEIVNLKNDRPKSLPCGHPFRLLTVPEVGSHKRYCWHCKHRALEHLSLLSVAQNQLLNFPSMQVITEALKRIDYDSISYEALYPNLNILSLEHNKLQVFPVGLHYLTKLSSVKLSYNEIQELPPEVGLLNARQLFILKLDGMNIRNIPPHLLQKPSPKLLLNYLKAIQQNSKPYHRVKLMVVGEGKKGKTSLLRSLTKKGKFKHDDLSISVASDLAAPEATAGVDIKHWKYAPRNKSKIMFMIWEFGGQEEYYAIHQCFLSKRSIYVLVWNVQDGEAGVRGLKTWLENIEACASKSPVIIVGTQMNMLNESQRERIKGRFTRLINDLYVNYSHSAYQYPNIKHVVFIYSQDDVDRLRDYIHDFASNYQFADTKDSSSCSIVDQLVPEFYLQLQDIIHSLATNCRVRNSVPIYDKETYRQAVTKTGFTESLEELDEATSFLHENGIVLHYDEYSLLSDIYFLDPQWLCFNLAKVVTVREDIRSHKSGFLMKKQLEQILDTKYQKELIALMEKFEIILFLDDRRLLIPSLLPSSEGKSCTVFSKMTSAQLNEDDTMAATLEHTSHTPLCKAPHQCLVRYYRLPFVPNGFFARVIARFMSTKMIDYIQSSLESGPLDDTLTNQAHWKCWRDGIIITWHHMEIFRIAPITFPLLGTTETHLISSKGDMPVETSKGIEIKVAILPEEITVKSETFPNERSNMSVSSHCRATWLFHQATTIVSSVFEDWYEVFAQNTNFDFDLTANPCTECLKLVCKSERECFIFPSQQRSTETQSSSRSSHGNSTRPSQQSIFYMFTSPYCSRALADGMIDIECPTHGKLSVKDVAPDLVFSDFSPSLVYTDSDCLILGRSLGDGGYGSVFKGILEGQQSTSSVAVKEFHTTRIFCTNVMMDQAVIAEEKAWEIYQKASLEARVMVQLQHTNIIDLIGITLQPLRLLVELAPMGDMKHCIEKFKKASIRLRRTTLKETLVQVAEAINYLHFNLFVYRDLKPGNILVWKYPEPDTQWNPNTQIWVKVADYGVSKQVSPQGLRGESGTRPYLPPEVLLCGGREAYSTKIDVYAFGMFMYYLMTFLSPFELQDRPLTALLAEGRRPELPPKLHPQSLQLFELMCWCWSDKPQHRPTLGQILKVTRTDSFTHLLEATPITTSKKNQVTFACLKSTSSTSSLSHVPAINSDGFTMTYSTVSKVLSPVEIWYGTRSGSCGVVHFNQSLTIKNFKLPSKGKIYISSIVTVGGFVWIGTAGSGLFVYRIHTHKPVATWGEEIKLEIFTLLHIRKTASILVLTHDGILIFDSDIHPGTEEVYQLEPRQTIEKNGPIDINQGVVIPAAGNVEEPEIWLCSRSGRGFSVLHHEKCTFIAEVYYSDKPEDKARVVRHMQPILVDGRSCLAVANRHLIERWDVKLRQKKDEFDMIAHCVEFFGNQRRKSRITTMTASGDLLYVGTGGGVLLALSCSTMEPHFATHAYTGPIRSLLLVAPGQQTKVFTRLFSQNKPTQQLPVSKPNPINTPAISTALKVSDSNLKLPERPLHLDLKLKAMEPLPAEQSVVISFGLGYRGVVGDSENCPQEFILPSNASSSCNRLKKATATKPAKPNVEDGHILLWSAGHYNNKQIGPMKLGSPQRRENASSPQHSQINKRPETIHNIL